MFEIFYLMYLQAYEQSIEQEECHPSFHISFSSQVQVVKGHPSRCDSTRAYDGGNTSSMMLESDEEPVSTMSDTCLNKRRLSAP